MDSPPSSWLRDTLRAFAGVWPLAVGLVGILLVPASMLFVYADAQGMPGALQLARFFLSLAWPLVAASMLAGLDQVRSEGRFRTGAALARGLSRWPLLFVAQVVAILGVLFGLLLLVLPGLYLAVRLAFLDPLVVLEGQPPMRALERAWDRTRGAQGRIAALWGLVVLLMLPGLVAAVFLDEAGYGMTTVFVEILSLYLPLCFLEAGLFTLFRPEVPP